MKKKLNILNIVITIILITIISGFVSTSYAGAVSADERPGGSGSTAQPGSNPYAPGAGTATVQPEEPMSGNLGTPEGSSGEHTVSEIINEAQDFVQGGTDGKVSGDNLKAASNSLYNILLTIGIFLAVAIGMYLGIKFMIASAEDKAKVKESLVPYIVGCVVIFGGFIIWKFTVQLLAEIELIAR